MFFTLVITFISIRIALYCSLRIDFKDFKLIWNDISPSDHWLFYIEEFLSNTLIIWYLLSMNKSVNKERNTISGENEDY